MTFVAPSPIILPIDKTVGKIGFALRLTICCKAMTICEATKTVSTVKFGLAPCPHFPLIFIKISSQEAI